MTCRYGRVRKDEEVDVMTDRILASAPGGFFLPNSVKG